MPRGACLRIVRPGRGVEIPALREAMLPTGQPVPTAVGVPTIRRPTTAIEAIPRRVRIVQRHVVTLLQHGLTLNRTAQAAVAPTEASEAAIVAEAAIAAEAAMVAVGIANGRALKHGRPAH